AEPLARVVRDRGETQSRPVAVSAHVEEKRRQLALDVILDVENEAKALGELERRLVTTRAIADSRLKTGAWRVAAHVWRELHIRLLEIHRRRTKLGPAVVDASERRLDNGGRDAAPQRHRRHVRWMRPRSRFGRQRFDEGLDGRFETIDGAVQVQRF